MYNLNVNVNPSPMAAAGLLGVAAAEVTPRTPEIVNSLIAMTNPFDGYSNDRSRERTDSMSSGEPSPPSVQHTCSQLIKEGLKLTLQTKRRVNGSSDEATKKSRKEDNSADDEEEDGDSSNNNSRVGLTPEDEERRRRRRERNKIAATKCRLKKREKTVILVQESEILETQNHDLKSEIKKLETQRRRLVDMLSHHGPTCIKQQNAGTNDYHQSYNEPLPSYEENFGTATSIITTTTTTTTNSSSLSSSSSSSSTSSTSSISSSRSTNSQAPIALNQPQNCVTDYPVKLEVYDATQDFYHRQDNSPYVPTTDSGCAV